MSIPRSLAPLRTGLLLMAVFGCSSPPRISTLTVLATDYAFTLPTEVPAGRTAVQLINQGTKRHELQLFRFARGISADSAGRLLATDGLSDTNTEMQGGILVAMPGDTVRQRILDDFESGNVYGLACQFTDSAGAPNHLKLGMFRVLRVR